MKRRIRAFFQAIGRGLAAFARGVASAINDIIDDLIP